MMGCAWQKGLVPVSEAALMQAVELNGVAVDKNKQAFAWGRAAAHDLAAVEALAKPRAEPRSHDLSGDLDEMVARRVGFLTDYQGAETIRLEQNYRSTQNILSAANAVISRNSGRREKNLWTAAGDGTPITGYVADSEHDEARWISQEVDRLSDEHGVHPRDVAVFYRTNAQSRALEEAFMRAGQPYKVIGGTRFYDRREIKDAIAYLRAVDNPDDDVNVRRILNEPKRGIGDRAEGAVQQAKQACEAIKERIKDRLECGPEQLFEISGLKPDADLPELEAVERKVERLLRERETMGPVNLRAEQEAAEMQEQIETLGTDKAMHEKLAATSTHMQAQDGRKKAARLLDGLLQARG